MRADERVLRDFLRVGVIAQAGEGDREHLFTITSDDFGKRGFVARQKAMDQRVIVRRFETGGGHVLRAFRARGRTVTEAGGGVEGDHGAQYSPAVTEDRGCCANSGGATTAAVIAATIVGDAIVGRLACRRRELHPRRSAASASQTPYK